MTTDMEKRAYVRAHHGAPTGGHTCHWPGCGERVPPAKWGCYRHWMRLPKRLRDKIWAAYRPGQERDKQPSRLYLQVARETRDWIAAHYRAPETKELP